MINVERVAKIAELCRQAERLARQEAIAQHHERKMTRLAATLWVCRDAAEQCFEEALGETEPVKGGRPGRDHY